MTPERWRRINDLFDAALRLDPAVRASWLQAACQGDDDLCAEVSRLLVEDGRADRDGFLVPPDPAVRPLDRTGSWAPRDHTRMPGAPESAEHPMALFDDSSGFAPKAAIVAGTRAAVSEDPRVVRARLRELPMIHILILGMTIVWKRTVIGDDDLTIFNLDLLVLASLGSIMALLASRRPVPLAWLRAIELGMIVMLAGRLAFVQYRVMLLFSLRDDRMMAQFTMKNIVLLTSVLILTYGLFVPKTWRRAAAVVVPLALLPFATLLVLDLAHPEPLRWIWLGWRKSDTPRVWLFSFDALVLFILAFGSAYGARTISSLRRQVAEARQLGQYRLGRRLGSGGMGEVYLAEHQLLKRPCALKLIRPGVMDGPTALERFEREVRLTATLSHPNTVEIFDYGRAEDGTYYYVMEYLPGLSLGDLVERHGPLLPGRAVYLLRQVCGALREAHAAGLIHRDIKPSNVFAARRGGMDDVAKLLDFGLVRPAAAPGSSHLSDEGQILGTPLYMSPEQATGRRSLDERSDIYSLGAVAYYLLTGRPPFKDGGAIEVLIAHARDPVVPPSRVRSGIPADLERVVMRCLAKNPADRHPDAASLERALAECASAGDWDQDRAARWWRNATLPPPVPAVAR